jgi:TonB-linked SusC/RagA family outer membrane protein
VIWTLQIQHTMNRKPTRSHVSIFRLGMFSVICCTLLTVCTEAAQASAKPKTARSQVRSDIIVHGKVSDKAGPVPGVTISLKNNTKTAVSTDANGNFSIRVPENGTLIFQAVGFNTLEVPVNGKTLINVTMTEGISNLDEVVVVGYTTKSLSQLSSSVAVVSGEKLRDVTSNDVTSMLQGKAAGVIVSATSGSPNAEPSIIVRGSSSITAGAGPLYVVDGVIGGTVNPNDVESVTILKDAAATGLYGSRASNGVIIITTKTGKAGNNQLNFSATTGLNTASMGNFDVMDSQQLYDYQKTFFDPAVFARDRPASILAQNTDWRSLAFQTGLTQNYTISASGGSEKTQVYISGNYYNEEGTVRTSGRQAYNLRTNITHAISSKLKLGVRLDASYRKFQEEASGNYGALVGATRNLPWDNPFNADGSIRKGTEEGWIGREHDNFLHGWQYNTDETRRSSLSTDVKLDYLISKNLTFTSSNRATFTNTRRELYYDVRAKAGIGLGQLTNALGYSNNLITSNRLLYDKSFGKHNLSAIAVAEAEKNYVEGNQMFGQGLVAGLHVMNAASQILSSGNLNGSISENAFSKGLVQVDYNYNNRYFAVGSYIKEASSRFGANHRSGDFYTLGASWILSNENFMADQKIFDLLKFRASYGSTGNAQIEDYQTLGLYSYSSQYSGFSASTPFQLANADLTWEKAKSFNLGLDIGFFKRISLNVDVYDKTSAALLLDVQLPYTSGFTSVIRNVGSVRNRGLELNLNTVNLNGAFRWETNFNIAFNKNRVMKLDQGQDIINDNGFDPPTIVSVGHDLNSFYMRKWAGVDPANGDPLWEKVSTDASGNQTITKTNALSEATSQYVGSFSPDFTGGFTNTFSYKAFSLSAFFNFVSGNEVYNSSRSSFDSDGAYETVNNMLPMADWSRWEKPGDVATHPKAVFGGNLNSNKVSSRFLEDGSYIRLRNINLGYELPKGLLARLNVKNARVFVSGDNLWTGTKYSGMDPEVSIGPGGGNSSDRYPISKKILFGINIGL